MSNLSNAESNTSSLDRQPKIALSVGVNRIGGGVIFVAGDWVLTRSGDNISLSEYELPDTSFRLDIDDSITQEEAFAGIYELIRLSPEIGRVLIAHVIEGLTMAAFKEAGIMHCGILMIVGKSGLLKSHYVPQIIQLYNRKDGVKPETRFNSSERFIEEIFCEYKECTIVVDDLHTAQSKSIKRSNETTAEEIIRRISDNTGRGRMEGKSTVQKEFNANVIFIGEYTIGQESTLPRVLVVPLTKRPDGGVLDKYQRKQPLLVSTFYYYFLRWYVENYEAVCNEIDKRLTELRQTASNTDLHGRLCDTEFCLEMSFMIFLEFCSESGFITEEQARSEYSLFFKYLREIVNDNQKRFQTNNANGNEDYLEYIKKLYASHSFYLADDKKSFDVDKHDGHIHNNCLHLRSEKLVKKLQLFFPEIDLNDIVNDLKNKKALSVGRDKSTRQIKGKRFLVIPLDKLM
ncbi:MAG: hypothetical protein HDT46_05385 [Ruminococcaceae bacterium]|nr:hypothetical protein [Oscillospiraceae bacterium]